MRAQTFLAFELLFPRIISGFIEKGNRLVHGRRALDYGRLSPRSSATYHIRQYKKIVTMLRKAS
jgi:hypothetical protein